MALLVPHRKSPIKIDGELDPNEDWNRAARTGPFVVAETNDAARPYSEARFLWDEKNLYIALYAADQDINAKVKDHDGAVWLDDSFSIRLKHEGQSPLYQIDVNAAGVVTDVQESGPRLINKGWESNIQVGVDADGTLNDPGDDDEEWVVEAALPLGSIGVSPEPHAKIFIKITRCDTPKDGKRRCGGFGDAGAALPPAAVLELSE